MLEVLGFLCSSAGKESTCNAGDPGSIPGSGRSPGEGIVYPFQYSWTSLVAHTVKNLPAVQEVWVPSLGWEDPWMGGMATHSSILAWRIPKKRGAWWASPWGCKELEMTEQLKHIGSPSENIQSRKIKDTQIVKKNVTICRSSDIIYIENPKDTIKNCQNNKFSKIAGYKIFKILCNFYMLIINYLKQKLSKQIHSQLYQK